MFNGEPKRFPKQIQKLYSIVRRMTVALYLSHARRLLSNAPLELCYVAVGLS